MTDYRQVYTSWMGQHTSDEVRADVLELFKASGLPLRLPYPEGTQITAVPIAEWAGHWTVRITDREDRDGTTSFIGVQGSSQEEILQRYLSEELVYLCHVDVATGDVVVARNDVKPTRYPVGKLPRPLVKVFRDFAELDALASGCEYGSIGIWYKDSYINWLEAKAAGLRDNV